MLCSKYVDFMFDLFYLNAIGIALLLLKLYSAEYYMYMEEEMNIKA